MASERDREETTNRVNRPRGVDSQTVKVVVVTERLF